MIVRPYQSSDFDTVTRFWRRAREVAVSEVTARMGYSFEMDCRHFKVHMIPVGCGFSNERTNLSRLWGSTMISLITFM